MKGLMKKPEGYLMIDHRASPGLPPALALRLGIDPRHLGEGKLFETATMRCAHCTVSVIKNPDRTRERARCSKCHAYICDGCAAVPICRPIEQVIDETLDGKTPLPIFARHMKG